MFADLALRLVSGGVSELDATTLPGRRPNQDDVLLAGGNCLAGIKEDGADALFEDMDPEFDDSGTE
jgi:hypothetical protein